MKIYKSKLNCYEEDYSLEGEYNIKISHNDIIKNNKFNKYIYLTFNIVSDILHISTGYENAKYGYYRLLECGDKFMLESIFPHQLIRYMKSFIYHLKRTDLLEKFYNKMSKIEWNKMIQRESEFNVACYCQPDGEEFEILKNIIENDIKEVNNGI